MKKLFAILLAIMMTAAMTLCVSAETSEAILDGDFEDSIGVVFANGGGSTLVQTSDVYYNGTASLAVTLRSSEWGGAAWDVTEYIKTHGTGEFYCTFAILGTFEGKIRATLHTGYEDGSSIYRQVGSLTEFKNNEWTMIGSDESGNPLPLRIENWSEEDITKWDPTISADSLSYATLYFWIEGDNYADLYMDNMNFWGKNDTPVDYTADGANTTPKVLELSVGDTTSFELIDDETDETSANTTAAPSTGANSTAATTTAAATETGNEDEGGLEPVVIIAIVAAVVVIAAVVVVVLKKSKKK